ncbi:hypothetical protein HK405_007267, partial [Cladochytrium tenue]
MATAAERFIPDPGTRLAEDPVAAIRTMRLTEDQAAAISTMLASRLSGLPPNLQEHFTTFFHLGEMWTQWFRANAKESEYVGRIFCKKCISEGKVNRKGTRSSTKRPGESFYGIDPKPDTSLSDLRKRLKKHLKDVHNEEPTSESDLVEDQDGNVGSDESARRDKEIT